MALGAPAAFFSYCRDDSDFALQLAEDLKAAGANVWLDQLDIEPGVPWDRAVESAVTNCPRMLVILSPTSVNSDNVRDEVSFALSKQKRVIPVLYRDCDVPFRLARLQHIDFRADYARGLKALLRTLGVEQQAVAASGAAVSVVPKESQPDVSDVDERNRAAERAWLEEERKQAIEQAQLKEQSGLVAEQARVEQEKRRAAEQARLEDERRKVAEQVRLEEERKQAAEQARVEQEHKRAADEAWLEDERPHATEEAKRTSQEGDRAEGSTNKKLLTKGWIDAFSASKFNLPRIASPTIRRSIGAGVMILIVAVCSWLVFHDRSHWNARNSGSTNSLSSIFGTSDGKRLWAVGSKGTILESDDGGEHWNARNGGRKNSLSSIFGTSDGKRLWAVGSSTDILESLDGGEHWSTVHTSSLWSPLYNDTTNPLSPLYNGTTNSWSQRYNDTTNPWSQGYNPYMGLRKILYSIFVSSDGKRLWTVGVEKDLFLAKSTILKSDDGGEHWSWCSNDSTESLFWIFGTSDDKRLWAVGEKGTILESDDGGEHWSSRNSGTQEALISIFGTGNGKRLWAVGEKGTILESDDGGEHWNARNSGSTNVLSSIFGTSDGKRLWAVGQMGTILESDDGGGHWSSRNSGTKNQLLSIFGTGDGKRLWAVGEKGTILAASVP